MRKVKRPRADRAAGGSFDLEILNCDEGEKWVVRTLSDTIWGMFVHWVKGKSKHCLGDECNTAWHRLEQQWYGYTYVEAWDERLSMWVPWCLEITERLELDFRHRFRRGQVWQISRRPKGTGTKNHPVLGELLEEHKPHTYPAEQDVRPLLHTVYHVPKLRLGVPNPMPDKIRVCPSPGAPPKHLADQAPAQPTAQELAERPKLVDHFLNRQVQVPNFEMPRNTVDPEEEKRRRVNEELAKRFRRGEIQPDPQRNGH